MSTPRVVHADPGAEYWFEEGCHIAEWWNSDADPGCSVARARVPPGGRTRWHALEGVGERYVVLSGRGLVEIGELRPTELVRGDVAWIPPGVAQRITALGDDELVFLAVCTPRFSQAAYRDLGDGPAPQPAPPARRSPGS